jgi:hypothetical protein
MNHMIKISAIVVVLVWLFKTFLPCGWSQPESEEEGVITVDAIVSAKNIVPSTKLTKEMITTMPVRFKDMKEVPKAVVQARSRSQILGKIVWHPISPGKVLTFGDFLDGVSGKMSTIPAHLRLSRLVWETTYPVELFEKRSDPEFRADITCSINGKDKGKGRTVYRNARVVFTLPTERPAEVLAAIPKEDLVKWNRLRRMPLKSVQCALVPAGSGPPLEMSVGEIVSQTQAPNYPTEQLYTDPECGEKRRLVIDEYGYGESRPVSAGQKVKQNSLVK